MKHEAEARRLVSRMTLDEKASLCSGEDFWTTKAVKRLGVPSVMLTDGPHGLRKQISGADQLGISQSVPATCFPPACLTACSFDPELLGEIGAAIGEECRAQDVAVLLGPGVNIKRSPLCGRSFEYFSEDPYLAGELAAGFINGLQSKNVGASLKHFALNNQEKRRMTAESVCDERAAREIYLSAFERAVKKSSPWTVMSCYNKLWGVHGAESKKLLTDILREEWGFDGLVMTDWGGNMDRVAGVRAGNDLEMPGASRHTDRQLIDAVLRGELEESALDRCAARVTELALRAGERVKARCDMAAHHALARRAAGECAVLLKNDGGLLPGGLGGSAAVIGAFARSSRYQGAGSSKINPAALDNAADELAALGLSFDYAPGYSLETDRPDPALIEEAVEAARGKDIVYLFAGLPDRYESEGFDRESLKMPESHCALIEAVAKVNPNTAVVLMGGGVMETPWAERVPSILLMYLGGEAAGGGAAELLLGLRSPCGKLAESWPLRLEDNPSFEYFPGWPQTVEYRESIFVGYRYYDTAKKPVRWPFGHGLSYSAFEYGQPVISGEGGSPAVLIDITNVGGVDGAEVVQLYVHHEATTLFRADQELKAFKKIFLKAGETGRVELALDRDALRYWSVPEGCWRTETGIYELRIGSSSRYIRRRVDLGFASTEEKPAPDYRSSAPCYYDLTGGVRVSDDEFEALLGRPIPPRLRDPGSPFTLDSTVEDLSETTLGRLLARAARGLAGRLLGPDEDLRRMAEAVVLDAPVRMLFMSGVPAISWERVMGLLDMLNGKALRGLKKLIKG